MLATKKFAQFLAQRKKKKKKKHQPEVHQLLLHQQAHEPPDTPVI